ncbi:MAG: type II toxin-antitoxin system RelE/ParE family toxin [Verrucomicrobiota bacterium]
MGKYDISFRRSVEKELRKIPERDQIKILRRIHTLAEDPRPTDCKKLSRQDRYRIRQGNYRILYEIEDRKLIVTVVKVGNRRDVYE